MRAGEEILQTKEETRSRWDRYAAFAEQTFNVQIPEIPYEQLEELDDAGQVQFVLEAVKESGVQIPGGIIEHQRTSYLDNRAIDTAEIQPYDGHVMLYMADRYHDDAITFEPRYATRQPDGGWGEYASDLEVVPIGGEHIQAIDEPYIAKVGAHMSQAINQIESRGNRQQVTSRRSRHPLGPRPPPRSWPNCARSWNWPRSPAARRPSPSGTRRAYRARGPAFTRYSTRAASWRSARCAKTPGDPNALYGDGVVTGHGTINGRPVGVFSHDQTVFQGSVGEMFGRKVATADGVGGDGRLPDHRHQRLGRRPDPGRGRRRWRGTPSWAVATSCCAAWCRRSRSSSANALGERCIRRSRPTWWWRYATRATCSSPVRT